MQLKKKGGGWECVDSKSKVALYLRAERVLIGNMNNFSIIVQLRRGTQVNSCELRTREEQIFFHFFGKIDRHGRWKVLDLGSRSLHELTGCNEIFVCQLY